MILVYYIEIIGVGVFWNPFVWHIYVWCFCCSAGGCGLKRHTPSGLVLAEQTHRQDALPIWDSRNVWLTQVSFVSNYSGLNHFLFLTHTWRNDLINLFDSYFWHGWFKQQPVNHIASIVWKTHICDCWNKPCGVKSLEVYWRDVWVPWRKVLGEHAMDDCRDGDAQSWKKWESESALWKKTCFSYWRTFGKNW